MFIKKNDIKEGKYTKLYQKHTPNSTGAKLVCIDHIFISPTKVFTGNNCVNDFIEWVFTQQERINQIIDNRFNKKLKITTENKNNYRNSEICWICNQKIIKDKVRDHITRKFRGAAHKECNSKLRIPRKLPIIFHNLEGYDGHIIFKELKLNNFDNIDIQVIPKSSEKYMSIIINKNIIFLDSLQFYKGSLDSLAGNLQDSNLKHLMSEFPPNKLEILRKKDAYPYEWLDSYEKFKYTVLPPKESFYSSIKDSKRDNDNRYISDDQYSHLKSVWNTFSFNTFKDFHNHCLKKDVLFLADVFENFISTSLKYYDLDPCHYFSAPGLSWDPMLKMTKVELEKITDPEKHLVERY